MRAKVRPKTRDELAVRLALASLLPTIHSNQPFAPHKELTTIYGTMTASSALDAPRVASLLRSAPALAVV